MLAFVVVTALASATASIPAAVDPDGVVHCVREEITGSLAKTRKVCHTVGEWRKISGSSNDEARRVIQPGTMNDQNR